MWMLCIVCMKNPAVLLGPDDDATGILQRTFFLYNALKKLHLLLKLNNF